MDDVSRISAGRTLLELVSIAVTSYDPLFWSLVHVGSLCPSHMGRLTMWAAPAPLLSLCQVGEDGLGMASLFKPTQSILIVALIRDRWFRCQGALRHSHRLVAVLLPVSCWPFSNSSRVYFFFPPCFCFRSCFCYSMYLLSSFAVESCLLKLRYFSLFLYKVLGSGQNKKEKNSFQLPETYGFFRLFLTYFPYNFAFLWSVRTRFKIKYCKPGMDCSWISIVWSY